MRTASKIIGAMVAGLLVGYGAAGQAPAKRAITFREMIALHRLNDPQISPDGHWIAYTVATPDLQSNRVSSDIWLVSSDGLSSHQLTHGESDNRPRWSPDGKQLAFLSSREGTAQVFTISAEGGQPVQITFLSGGADSELWSPDGKWIAFASRVYPDCPDDTCNVRRDQRKEASPVKARIYEQLLYRHWTQWWDGKRSHLFIVSAEGGTPRDLTSGADFDVPPFSLDSPEAIAFSPDSSELCFTAKAAKDAAISTNSDLYIVRVAAPSTPRRITTNPAADWGPAYSPDGKWIAYRAQMQPGYESDRWRLMLYDRAGRRAINLTENFDRNVDSAIWSPDSKTIYFQTEDHAEMPIYAIAARPGASPRKVIANGFNDDLSIGSDGGPLVFTRSSLAAPADVFTANADGSAERQLTHQNEAALAQLDLPGAEPFWFAGAGGTSVEGILLRPPQFDASRKYPLLLLVHGGPQSEWDDAWGYRWNPQVMAAPGYVVLMINPRGSFGYGQKFTEEISGDWGGKVYEDLMKGVDAALAKHPFIDSSRMAEAGGSFGGFMTDWIATHSGRFKCLISHAGPWDMTSMFGSTEELWFMEWEFRGTPWTNPSLYRKWSPSEHAGALGKFRTPTLVIGGELDFRVPYTQDLEFFTALQRQGVPSKLVIFPDEGHFILKPRNSELWYRTFLAWLARYLHESGSGNP